MLESKEDFICFQRTNVAIGFVLENDAAHKLVTALFHKMMLTTLESISGFYPFRGRKKLNLLYPFDFSSSNNIFGRDVLIFVINN